MLRLASGDFVALDLEVLTDLPENVEEDEEEGDEVGIELAAAII